MEVVGLLVAGAGLKLVKDYIQSNKGDIDVESVPAMESSIDMTQPMPNQIPVNQYPDTQALEPASYVQGYGLPNLSYQLPPLKSGGLPVTQSLYAPTDTDPLSIQWTDPNAYVHGQEISASNNDPAFDSRAVENINAYNFSAMNPLVYEEGMIPVAYGAFDGNPERPDSWSSELFQPPKIEVSQDMMRAPPQVQTNVHGNAPTHMEEYDRILEQTKLLSGTGAYDFYRPGGDSGFASGELITERKPNITRVYPIIPAKQGVQIYGRLGNVSKAIGKVGSEYGTERGPLGELRQARNAFVSEYERIPMPTATAQTNQPVHIGQVILKDTQRQTTEIPWVGQVGQQSKNQAALRLEQPYIKPKNLVSSEIVGAVGVGEYSRGGYQNIEFDLPVLLRNLTEQTPTENIQQPGTMANFRGSYQNIEFDLPVLLRNLTEQTPTENIQQPGTMANERGVYQNLEYHLKGLQRDTTGQVGTEHVQQPGTQANERGVYSNLEVTLPVTLKQLASAEAVGGVGTVALDRGAYSNVEFDIAETKRDLSNAESVGAPMYNNGLGTYANSEITLSMTNRGSITGKDEQVGAPYDPTKGTAAAYESIYNSRVTNRSTPGYENGRPGGPVAAENEVADWWLKKRINDYDMELTLKDVDTFNQRVPMADRTNSMQYPMYIQPESRRVTPRITQEINPELLDALRSNPYTQPITNDPPPRPF